jgi:hypothetical protein
MPRGDKGIGQTERTLSNPQNEGQFSSRGGGRMPCLLPRSAVTAHEQEDGGTQDCSRGREAARGSRGPSINDVALRGEKGV